MSLQKNNKLRKERRAYRVRKNVKTGGLLRVSVFKSLNHIYGQIIDDSNHQTLVSCSSLELDNIVGDKKAAARAVGLELAKKALAQGLNEVAFDRGRFLYHGRVKELADGLREGGLKF